jgi:hypothetical protein
MVVTALFTGAEIAVGKETVLVHCANVTLLLRMTTQIKQKNAVVKRMLSIFTIMV